MKRGAGKAKGSAFERAVAKDLSLWLTGGNDGKQLIRSVLSGGWRAGQAGSGEGWRQVGDLAPNGPVGEQFRQRFAVECKHRRDIDLYGLWTRQDAILEWWAKLKEEIATVAAQTNTTPVIPMLVFRANGRPIMCGVPSKTAEWLRMNHTATFKWVDLTIFPFEQLLKCSPARVLSGSME